MNARTGIILLLALSLTTTAFATAVQTNGACAIGKFNLEQAITDQAQLTTLAFDGLAMITGNLQAQSFFPPGKLVDYWGFQYLRDNDPSDMGHNTSFLTRVACNVIYTLDANQLATLKQLATSQVAQINQYGYKRYPLMKAFRRLMDGDLPAGATGLDRQAVMAASRDLYVLDGQISFDRAVTYAAIYRSFSASQKAYIDAMVGKGWSDWPNKSMEDVRDKMAGLSQDESVAVMTYAGDLFSWYAGCVDADVYFCPERHGTYYGGFYIKDAPAIGHEGYSINEQLTATAGAALCDAGKGYVTAAQAALVSSLLEVQRNNLYAGTSSIVQARKNISTALRTLITPTAPSEAFLVQVKATVLDQSSVYGSLDGENNYYYATVFRQVARSLSDAQLAKLASLRHSIMSGTYADGAPFDFTSCSTYYLYSAPVADPAALAPYLSNTDYLFGLTSTPTASFSFSPSAPLTGQAVQFADSSSGSPTAWSWSFGDGSNSTLQNPTHAFATAGNFTVTLTVTNANGSNSASRNVSVSAANASFTLTSDAGVSGGSMSTEYTCDGTGASPALYWSGAPAATKEFALLMATATAQGIQQYNWVLYRIPATTASIAKNSTAAAIVGAAQSGTKAYDPPCSQGPGPRVYTFTIYALSSSPTLPADASQVTGDVLGKAIAPLTLGSASLSLTYTRNATASWCSGGNAYYVPAGGHLTGANGTQWLTDLAIQNGGTSAVQVSIDLLENGNDNSSPAGTGIAVPAGQQIALTDVFLAKFGRQNVAGALRLCSAQPLRVMSRTYNLSPSGTFGQAIPGLSASSAIAAGARGSLIFLSEGERFRTNLGIVNAGPTAVTGSIDLYDGTGALLGSVSYSLRPWESVQRSRIFSEVTMAEVSLGSAVIKPASGSVIAYASVIDNATGDPLFMTAER